MHLHLEARTRWSIPPLILGILFFSPPFLAAAAPTKYKALRQQAEFYERQADWDKACLAYENILRLDRALADVQERYQICLRRYWQVKRHSDPSFRKEVLSLDYAQSLRLYTMIGDTLLDNALDKKKTDPGSLFRKGMEEFDNALTDPYFLQQYLPAAKPHDIRAFRDFLRKTWDLEEKINRPQALKQLRAVALAAQNMLQLNSNVVVMEFACGACHALDEYTLYLTPNQLRALCDSLRGEFAGVGLTVRLDDNRVLINEVIPYSPAGEIRNPPLAKDDQVMSIDKKPVSSAEAAQELLDGPVGSSVDLEIYSPGMPMRTVTLRRRNLYLPSVSYHMKDDRIGYLHIACFQDTTVREIEDALAALAKDGMQAVLLDIRGNNGGVFEAAIETARQFLSSGV
ncbi:MAG TPA: S41 family peptidase, partial [Gemmataceae bacterium]|nr:S41 family peptidase [Gemmataceae bacterium]